MSCFRDEITPYTAFIGRDKMAGGTWTGHGSTPQAALREAFAKVHAEADEIMSIAQTGAELGYGS